MYVYTCQIFDYNFILNKMDSSEINNELIERLLKSNLSPNDLNAAASSLESGEKNFNFTQEQLELLANVIFISKF